jgi:hypothetical protein
MTTLTVPQTDSLGGCTSPASPPHDGRLSGRECLFLGVLILASVFSLAAAHLLGRPEYGYMMFVAKEGIVESLGAAACLLSIVLFAAAAAQTKRKTHAALQTSRRWQFLAALAVVSGVMFLEELGWGLRLWAWVSPSSRIRSDFSLGRYFAPKHAKMDVVGFYWFVATFAYGALLSVAAGTSRSIRAMVERARLPIPSRRLGMVWLATAMFAGVLLVAPGLALMQAAQRGEVFETIYEILIAAWALEEYRRASGRRLRQASWKMRLGVGVVAAVSIAAIGTDVAFRTLPFTKSQMLLASATPEQDPEKRIAILREAIRLYPANDLAHYQLGVALDELDRLPEGLGHLRRAVQLVPENSIYHFVLGSAYLNMRDAKLLSAAEFHLQEALRLDPASPKTDDILLSLNYIDVVHRIAEQMTLHPKAKEILEEFERRGRRLSIPK